MVKKQKVWEEKQYYQIAHKASLDLSHPGLRLIKEQAKKAKKVLEVGCGEGTKLAGLTSGKNQVFGIDISKIAIKQAIKQYPKIKFFLGNAEKLPFENESFDLVYSAFFLEHVDRPEVVIEEMIRVLKKGGKLIIWAPNYGAPNQASPCFHGSKGKKLLKGFVSDLKVLLAKPGGLAWQKVKPLAKGGKYKIDWDTSVEPYLGSLINFLLQKKLKICQKTSFWQEIGKDLGLLQRFFKFLGSLKVYPFVYWGPHLLVSAEKL